jgi:flagellar biosynthetic protein FliQ
MVVGILVNIVQTITQIKDQSLTFVPKLVVVGIILVLAVPWYLQVLEGFVLSMFALAAECGP